MDGLHKQEAEVERLLVGIRPEPSQDFVDRTERRLLGRSARRFRSQTFIAAVAVTCGLAVTLLVASLVGSGPLAPDGGSQVRAVDNCTTATVKRTESVGRIVQAPDGAPRVVSTPQTVTESVRHCR